MNDMKVLKEVVLSNGLMVSMAESTCHFAFKRPTRLIQLSVLEPDNTYLSEDEIKKGVKGWMSCGTHYFHLEQREQANSIFSLLVLAKGRMDKQESYGISIESLPPGDDFYQKLANLLTPLTETPVKYNPYLQGFSSESLALLIRDLSCYNLSSPPEFWVEDVQYSLSDISTNLYNKGPVFKLQKS